MRNKGAVWANIAQIERKKLQRKEFEREEPKEAQRSEEKSNCYRTDDQNAKEGAEHSNPNWPEK